MGSANFSPVSVSPSVSEQGRQSLFWVGGEMNQGWCTSSEMQFAIQVLSINYRAWASCRSRGENRPLAPIKFNGVWTPNSLSLFENQNASSFRNARGQVKSLVPLQAEDFHAAGFSRARSSSPGTGVFGA